MAMLKTITAHNKCENIRNYLLKQGRGIGVVFHNLIDQNRWDLEMDQTRHAYGHDSRSDSVSYRHFIYAPDPYDNCDIESLQAAAGEWATLNFENCQWVLVCHQDSGKLHAHIVVNSTELDTGRKVQINDARVRELAKTAQTIGKTHGFSELPDLNEQANALRTDLVKLTQTERSMLKRGKYSWKSDVRDAVDMCQIDAYNFSSFQNLLRNRFGISCYESRSGLTYVLPSKQRVTSAALGEAYTWQSIYYRLNTENWFHRESVGLAEPHPKIMATPFELAFKVRTRSQMFRSLHNLEEMLLAINRHGVTSSAELVESINSQKTNRFQLEHEIEQIKTSSGRELKALNLIGEAESDKAAVEWLQERGIFEEDYLFVQEIGTGAEGKLKVLNERIGRISNDLKSLESALGVLSTPRILVGPEKIYRHSDPAAKRPVQARRHISFESQNTQTRASSSKETEKRIRYEETKSIQEKHRAQNVHSQSTEQVSMRQRKAMQTERDRRNESNRTDNR